MKVVLLLLAVLCVGVMSQTVQQFIQGTDATLQCSFSSLKDPELITKMKWFFRGKKIKNGGRYKLKQSGLNFTLTVKKVKSKDKGAYICSPTVPGVSGVSDGTFSISVIPPPVPEAQEARNISFIAGSTKSAIRCSFGSKDTYKLELYWTKDGKKLRGDKMEDERVMSYEKNGTDFLQFNDVTMENKGRFACNYKYKDGRVFTMEFDVAVEAPQGPQDVVREINWGPEFVRGALQCDMSSLENITIQDFFWEKDGEQISDSAKYTVTENGPKKYLQIQDLANEDSGQYRCIAILEYYPVAVAFNVKVERGNKDQHYGDWSEFSVCKDKLKYRFRVCLDAVECEQYDVPYDVDRVACVEEKKEN